MVMVPVLALVVLVVLAVVMVVMATLLVFQREWVLKRRPFQRRSRRGKRRWPTSTSYTGLIW